MVMFPFNTVARQQATRRAQLGLNDITSTLSRSRNTTHSSANDVSEPWYLNGYYAISCLKDELNPWVEQELEQLDWPT